MSGLWADLSDLENPTAPNAQAALESASYLMWVLSGRRWSGVKTVTEEYMCINGMQCCEGVTLTTDQWMTGRTAMAALVNDPFWGHLEGQRFLFLRKRPVRKLISVRRCYTGEELPLAGLSVYDYAYLAPNCRGACDVTFNPCGLEVTYQWGSVPPTPGKLAAIDLANELVKAVECPDECKLPERVTSISRQGLSYQVFDPQDYLQDGRVGLYSADIFLKAVNPHRAQAPARVFSVDMPQARRKTWPYPATPTEHQRIVRSYETRVNVTDADPAPFEIIHGLGQRWVDVAVYRSTGQEAMAQVTCVDNARVQVDLNGAQVGEYTVVVLGRPL